MAGHLHQPRPPQARPAEGEVTMAETRAATSPQWLRVTAGPLRGGEMLLRPGAAAWQEEMRDGRFEAFLHDAVSDADLAAATVWDVGAHVGYHTLAFAARIGSRGRVIAFEPNPHNAARLRENLARNPALGARVRLETTALSDEDGTSQLFHTANVDDGTSSGAALEAALTRNNEDAFRALASIAVGTARGDTLVRNGRAPVPSLLKIDVEGGELCVLRGCGEVLAGARPLLLIEVHSATTMFRTQAALEALGYEVTLLEEGGRPYSRCHVMARPHGVP